MRGRKQNRQTAELSDVQTLRRGFNEYVHVEGGMRGRWKFDEQQWSRCHRLHKLPHPQTSLFLFLSQSFCVSPRRGMHICLTCSRYKQPHTLTFRKRLYRVSSRKRSTKSWMHFCFIAGVCIDKMFIFTVKKSMAITNLAAVAKNSL